MNKGKGLLGEKSDPRRTMRQNYSECLCYSTQKASKQVAWDVFYTRSCITIEIFNVTLLFETIKIHFIHNSLKTVTSNTQSSWW